MTSSRLALGMSRFAIFRLFFVMIALGCVMSVGVPSDAWANTHKEKKTTKQAQAKKSQPKKNQAKRRGPTEAQLQAMDARKQAYIVIEANSGRTISSSQPDKQVHPASLTKMMTLLLTFDALAEKRLRTTDYIKVSARAASMSPSKLGIRAGGRIRVDDAIRAVSVKSANDIAVALAEAQSVSESRFAQKMNERAKSIGMQHTRFVNASGLHNQFQLTTARDMAILSRYLLLRYPGFYRYFGLSSFTYEGRVNNNHNKLMARYPGMDGLKTGYISQSGFNLAASAVRGDRRLIGVVFGGRTARSRDDRMEDLLNAAFEKPADAPKIAVQKLPSYPPMASTPPAVEQPDPEHDVKEDVPPPANQALTETETANEPIDGAVVAVPDRKPRAVENATQETKLTKPVPVRRETRPAVAASENWAIQIGAYQSRSATDQALYNGARKLPRDLVHASPIVAPYRSSDGGWLFRARFGGLTEAQARRACTHFKSCLVLLSDPE